MSNIRGDVNNDNVINNKDLSLLQKYLNGWDVNINLENADVNNAAQNGENDGKYFHKYLSSVLEFFLSILYPQERYNVK